MSIKHKFLDKKFKNGFYTESAILKNKAYRPEVLFLGTFNPKTSEKANVTDFFYGRNWFWPLLFSIANKDENPFKQRRYSNPFFPTLNQILNFSTQYKLCFADMICEALPDIKKENYCLAKNKIIYNGVFYDLINDNALIKLDKLSLIKWNQNIVDYIKNNSSIKTVYFTRKFSRAFDSILSQINEVLEERKTKIKYLYTPSGQGLKGKPRYKVLKDQWLNSKRENFNCIDSKLFITKNIIK